MLTSFHWPCTLNDNKSINECIPGRAKISFRVPSKSKVANVVGKLKTAKKSV